MSDCLFCRIAAGEIPARSVYADPEMLAFHDVNPQAPVHVLLIPRRHISTLFEARVEDQALLGRLVLRAGDLARELGLETGGFRLVANTLAGAGQSVFHLHFHILGGRSMSWPPG
ncbi:MAG: histidine triad nucleotide-binding protein [Acidobacteriota bacterium]